MRSTMMAVALVAGLVALPASAQRGQGWSSLAAEPVGDGALALHVEGGFPGLQVGFLAGLGQVDLGVRAGFNYHFEGFTHGYYRISGLRGQGLLRVNLLKSKSVNVGLRFEPGFFTYFTRHTTDVGLLVPAGVTVGLPVSSALNVALTVDVPLFVLWGEEIAAFGQDGVYVPIQFGAGIEYFLDRGIALTAQTKMGPGLRPYGGAEFALQFLVGVAFKL